MTGLTESKSITQLRLDCSRPHSPKAQKYFSIFLPIQETHNFILILVLVLHRQRLCSGEELAQLFHPFVDLVHRRTLRWRRIPALHHESLDWFRQTVDDGGPLAFVHAPHDAVGELDFFEWKLARYAFPQNDAPAEHVAAL